jgi:hypothetical protein
MKHDRGTDFCMPLCHLVYKTVATVVSQTTLQTGGPPGRTGIVCRTKCSGVAEYSPANGAHKTGVAHQLFRGLRVYGRSPMMMHRVSIQHQVVGCASSAAIDHTLGRALTKRVCRTRRYQAANREVQDLQEEFQREREDMLDTIRQVRAGGAHPPPLRGRIRRLGAA